MDHLRYGFVRFAKAARHGAVGRVDMIDGFSNIQVSIATGPVRTTQAGIRQTCPGTKDNDE